MSRYQNHSTDVERPKTTWTPLHLMSTKGRSEEELLEHVSRLKQEIQDLRDYAERVTKELRKQQLQRQAGLDGPINNNLMKLEKNSETSEESKGMWGDKAPLPSWSLNMQLMCPLLQSYDDRIHELEGVVERRDHEIKSLSCQFQTALRENEELSRELQQKTTQLQIVHRLDSQGGGSAASATVLKQEKDELEELYNITREQNDVLLQQNQFLKQHTEEGDRRIRTLATEVKEISQQLAEKTETEKKAVQHANSVLAHLRALESTSGGNQADMKKMTKEREELLFQITQLKEETTSCQKACKEIQSQKDELQRLLSEERHTSCEKTAMLEQRERGKSSECLALEEEVHKLKEALKETRRTTEVGEREVEEIRQLLNYMDQKVAQITADKETTAQQLQKQISEAQRLSLEKEKVQATLNTMNSQLDRLRFQSAAEIQSLKMEHEETLNSTTAQLQNQISGWQQKLSSAEQRQAECEVKLETTEHQRIASESEVQRTAEHLKTLTRTHQALVKEQQQKLLAAEKERDDQVEELKASRAAIVERSAALTSLANKKQEDLDNLYNECATKTDLLRTLEEKLHDVESVRDQLTSDKERLVRNFNAFRTEAARETEELRQKELRSTQQLQQRLNSCIKNAEEKQQRAAEILKDQENLHAKWRNEFEIEKTDLANHVRRMQHANRCFRTKMIMLIKSLSNGSNNNRISNISSLIQIEPSWHFPNQSKTSKNLLLKSQSLN